ncbi:unnamed protein product [Schistosoma curassoni]|uniref:PHD-type domain-containing protein n=1 Tax=Schistosoma curassoni TaxID=6186 RepID=A0A183KX65_9TREM|nr:unnamed protein product [Schistosoma curassoni]
MQCRNCKVWFHEACTDLTATAYNRLSKSDHKWECITCNTDDVVLLSNIIVLLTGLRSDWSHVNRAKKDQVSPSKPNIPSVVRKSTGDLASHSTPKNVHPVIKEPRFQKRALTSKQQGAEPERTGKPGKQ